MTIPPNYTDHLPPLDISVNKPCKDFIRARFIEWYKVAKNMDNDDFSPINTKMTTMKPLGANWMIFFYYYMLKNPKIIYNGFNSVGIADIILLKVSHNYFFHLLSIG